MNKLRMTLAGCMLSAMVNAQSIMTLSPERPIAGDTVTIAYNPETTELKGLAPVTGVMYLFRNNDWEAHDLTMKMTDSGWVTKYRVPENTALIVSDFSANGITDKGKRIPYAALISDKEGKQLPGSYAAWGFLRTEELKDDVPQAAADTANITDEVALFWMNNELKYFPESRRKIFYNSMVILKHSGAERADSVIRREINFISSLKDVTEDEWMSVSRAYRNLLHDFPKADSMDSIIMAKYPDGITARDKMIFKMFRAGADERLDLWKSFTARFPLDKFENVHTEINELYYAKVYRGIVYQEALKSKNLHILDSMMDGAPLVCLTEFHRLLVMNALAHNEITLAVAFPYSKQLVERIEACENKNTGRFYSPEQWKQQVLNFAVPAFFGHASLLHQQNDDKSALVWLEKVKGQPNTNDAEFMGLYATLLENNGRHDDAIQVAENSARANKITPEAIALLKKEYARKHKSEEGFDAYFQGMKSATQQSAEQEELRAQLIHKDAPAFKLEQLKGGTAELSKMKGKIVVIDFWATWCGPCKAALPGMQMAVDKYSKDDKVNFFFIATEETKPDYKEEIKKFLVAKDYHLTVLLDGKNSSTGHLDDTYNKYAKVIGASGIPAKVIIDQHGIIRWLSTGYKGSPSALADEISYIIELLKKEG